MNKIQIVDPGNVLAAVSHLSTKAESNQPEQRIECPAAIRNHRHSQTQQNLPGVRRLGFVQRPFPRCRNINAESPGVRHSFFSATEDSCAFVIWGIVTMSVYGCCTGLKPDSWRPRGLRNGSLDSLCRFHSRPENRASVGGRISAVHTATCKIDDNIRPIDGSCPTIECLSVLWNDKPRLPATRSAEHRDFIALCMKITRKDSADLTASSWYDDFHSPMNLFLCSALGIGQVSYRPNIR